MVAASEMQCVLLNPVEADECDRLLDDPAWATQPKLDGVRFMLGQKAGTAYALNRKGAAVRVPAGISLGIDADYLVDGELVGDELHVFDILELDGECLRGLPVEKRHAILSSVAGHGVSVVPLATGMDKRNVYETSRNEGGEGVVFKRIGAAYSVGRPSRGGDYLKFKFYATCSCEVMGINKQRSVRLRMGCGTEVGNVTIQPNRDIPSPGDVVEVRYLYAYRGGCLYQPTYLGTRSDVDPDQADSLKFKKTSKTLTEDDR